MKSCCNVLYAKTSPVNVILYSTHHSMFDPIVGIAVKFKQKKLKSSTYSVRPFACFNKCGTYCVSLMPWISGRKKERKEEKDLHE